MSNGKHTPGPWAVTGQPDKVCTNYGDDADYGRSGAAKTICTANQAAWMTGPMERFANARLIAASPELLEALKDALELLEQHYPQPARNGQIARARAAITKAEGRT